MARPRLGLTLLRTSGFTLTDERLTIDRIVLSPPNVNVDVTTLHTERLTLRQWTLDDFEAFAAMSGDAEVMRFITPDGQPLSRFAAWQAFCAIVGHWHLREYGLFAAIENVSGQFVGRVGGWHPEGWPEFEIGWTIRKEFWGKGYATEAARKCIDYAFTESTTSGQSDFAREPPLYPSC